MHVAEERCRRDDILLGLVVAGPVVAVDKQPDALVVHQPCDAGAFGDGVEDVAFGVAQRLDGDDHAMPPGHRPQALQEGDNLALGLGLVKALGHLARAARTEDDGINPRHLGTGAGRGDIRIHGGVINRRPRDLEVAGQEAIADGAWQGSGPGGLQRLPEGVLIRTRLQEGLHAPLEIV